jgi:hypothetical protein
MQLLQQQQPERALASQTFELQLPEPPPGVKKRSDF